MTELTTPCGARYEDAGEAMHHAATCPVCRTYAEAQSRPKRKTITARKDAANEARKALAAYRDNVSNTADDERVGSFRVRRLGWALAHIERALYHETGGTHGRVDATGKTALEARSNR